MGGDEGNLIKGKRRREKQAKAARKHRGREKEFLPASQGEEGRKEGQRQDGRMDVVSTGDVPAPPDPLPLAQQRQEPAQAPRWGSCRAKCEITEWNQICFSLSCSPLPARRHSPHRLLWVCRGSGAPQQPRVSTRIEQEPLLSTVGRAVPPAAFLK